MITNFNKGYKYQNTNDYSPLASEVWKLYFSSSSWYVNGKEVRSIIKLNGQQPVLYDVDGNYLDRVNVIGVFQFVVRNFTGTFDASFLNNINEIVPTITFNPTNCIGVLIQDVLHYGNPYEAYFVANNGYSLVKAIVLITMNGEDITEQYYDPIPREFEYGGNTYIGTHLLIPEVDEDVEITISAIQVTSLDVYYDTTHVATQTPSNVNYGEDVTIQIKTSTGYSLLENPKVVIGGVDVSSQCTFSTSYGSVYTYKNIYINIPFYLVSDDIYVEYKATSNPTLTFNLTGVHLGGTPKTNICYGASITSGLYLDVGYTSDEINAYITIGGVSVPTIVTINPSVIQVRTDEIVTGNVVYNVTAKQYKTFNFYEKDNTTIAGTYTGLRITKLLVERTGDDVNIVINDNEDVISYTEVLTEHESFQGLTLNAGSIVVYVPVDVSTNVNFDTDTNFYEVIKSIPVVPTDFKLYFYKNGAESNKVDKTNDLTFVAEITGILRSSTSIINPIFTIEMSGIPEFNYVYVPFFKRYYYVREITSLNQNLWAINMNVDVLMSFKDTIRNQVGLIGRNENEFNNEIVDDSRIIKGNPNIEVVEIPNTIFNNTDEGQSLSLDKGLRYVLTCVKGDE